MNNIIKIGATLFLLVLIIAIVLLKPIITHEFEYTVIVANTSEHPISSVTISGAGENSGPIGPIQPGHVRHYIFTPQIAGTLEYSIIQHSKELRGVIDASLEAGEAGEVYVVLGEMYRVKVQNDLNI